MFCGHHRYAYGRQHWRSPGLFAMGWQGRFFGPGEVRLAILSLVAEGPSHGYELMRKLEDRSGGVYRASAGTTYPTLQQLEDEGLIASQMQDGRRVYRITEAGSAELRREEEAVRRIWRRAQQLRDWRSAFHPGADEVRAPAERLVKAAFRAVAGEFGEERVERVRSILERALRELDEQFGRKD